MTGRLSSAPRGPRHGSPSIRGRGRGGIEKARPRPGPIRLDKDGDLVMDAAVASGARKSGKGSFERSTQNKPSPAGRASSGRPSRGGNVNAHRVQEAIVRGIRSQQANVLDSRITKGTTTLRVDGLASSKASSNPDGGLESLLSFLERKASGLDSASSRTIKIKKSLMEGDSVIITASPEDIAQIKKLDNFGFAGTSLRIRECSPPADIKASKKDDGPSAQAVETKERIRQILANRYDTNLKLLNLSALGQDPDLVQMGMFDKNTTTSKVFPALMAVCDGLFKTRPEKKDAISSVTLTDNALVDLAMVGSLAQTFPDLKNLDLSRNQFSDLAALEPWRSKFRHLERLDLADNPVIINNTSFHTEIMKWYPTLLFLNGTQVRTPEEVAATAAAAKSPIPVSGPDFRDVAQVGENFIRQFIVLYDTDRDTLLSNFYDDQSVHSISINMSAARDPLHSAPIPPWAPYTKHSRNLVKITHLNARISRQYRGQKAIQPVWASLPATHHPDLQMQADKYMIECQPLPGLADPTGQSIRGVDGLLLTIHGEFEEKNDSVTDKAMRSFSRTFILGPGAPGGPPIRVVSDMVVLRAWAPVAQPTNVVAPPQEIINPGGNTQQAEQIQQQQAAVALQLQERTGMTAEYAMLCLTETGWDLEMAVAAFNANRDKLPPDAFMQGAVPGLVPNGL